MKVLDTEPWLPSILFLTVFIAGVLATRPASTFIVQGDQKSNLTLSVNVPLDPTNDDLFFHVSAPAGHAWVGFGFGTEMKDALIFVAYPSENGKNVTLSPRIGPYHEEPEHTKAVGVHILEGTFVDNETYNINAHCTSCRSWPLRAAERGKIDVTSTAQPMIYALGPVDSFLHSDSQEASITQHIAYGKLMMDLTTATGEGGVPSLSTTESGVVHGQYPPSGRLTTIVHGVIMAACFVVFFPLGALLTRLPVHHAFWIHVICQCSTILLILVGFTLGIYNSVHNNKHPKLNSPHQGLGLTLILLLIIQPTLGFRGFLYHRKEPQPHSLTLAGKIHRYLGPGIILAGIINGALGLVFANDTDRLPAYFGLFLFIAIIYALTYRIFQRRRVRNNAVNSAAAANFRAGATPATAWAGSAVASRSAYDVPLQSYEDVDRLSHRTSPSLGSFRGGNADVEHAPPVSVNVMPKNEETRMS
ncbi:hypothetical protein EPUS_07634 [Endocarpon pusillum Z07020]|uniref:DOMON domain-containing protein n=1 Tax=Endocarpon pusillum (strain Z07020 / HMAS-L-300199) TaxID=1263415 RepID=U1I428_ENDPU|nr:uncharacterized protein EPUS_07634 [Endocarpon pusillum Z07020]ERF76844.1 hypothetical protein EPUS_07634 [Endocarpon pusillum Z07020]